MLSKKIIRLYKKRYKEGRDKLVFDFLSSAIGKRKKIKYLEAGSGWGRFAKKINNQFNFDITCLEINFDLAKSTKAFGLDTVNQNIIKTDFSDNNFDIIHCSHVLEHFNYPNVIKALNEMLRILKGNGYLIIRGPLMHPGFYDDIDHVRPYSPDSITNYFKPSLGQQEKGGYKVEEVLRKYRRKVYFTYNPNHSRLKYVLAALFSVLWLLFSITFGYKNGYLLIIKKITHAKKPKY